MKIQKAVRPQIKLKVMLTGFPGSGKTWSSLMMAKEWCNGDITKVCVINTEGQRGLMYADQFDGYSIINITAPYNAKKLTDAIALVANSKEFDVIIIDSISDVWEQEKLQTLAVVNDFGKSHIAANNENNKMLRAIENCDLHVVCCCRCKHETVIKNVITKTGQSRTIKENIGIKEIQSDTCAYFFFSNLKFQENFFVTEGKNNPDVFEYGKKRKINPDLARDLIGWANNGVKRTDYLVNFSDRIEKIASKLRSNMKTDEEISRFYVSLETVKFDKDALDAHLSKCEKALK
jgi:nucleoside-triphosphatase THEP1